MDIALHSTTEAARAAFGAVAELFEQTFGYRPHEPSWARFYFANPYGAPIVALGYQAGRLVGHHALVPQLLVGPDGRHYPYYLSMSLMLHPEHRGLPPFHQLVSATTEAAGVRRAPFLLGFPNSNSHALFQRSFGWQTLLETGLYTWRPDRPPSAPTRVEALAALRLSNEIGPPGDASYRAWRSRVCAYTAVRVEGRLAAIYKLAEDGTLNLLDVLAEQPEYATHDLGALLTWAMAHQIRLTGVHALALGLDPAKLERHNDYQLRMCYAALEEPPPALRFSLLLSDVF
jgi:hypothetical protein